MFFPEKIIGINPGDRVLEVGPGGTPHPRSDVFLERIYANEADWESQRGHTPKLKSHKETVYYEGGKFPFKDNEFDYVICSHVIEHVEDVAFFLSELFRVAPKGYLEYPTICYEYLYNFDVHLNFIKFKNGKLLYLKKEDTNLNQFLAVQKLFHHSLGLGYSKLVEDLSGVMFEGFEWVHKFEAKRAEAIDELVGEIHEIPRPKEQYRYGFITSVARKLRKAFLPK